MISLIVTQHNQLGAADPRPSPPTWFDPTPDPVPNTTPLTTDYTYDALGRLVRVRDALGNVTSVAFDSLGRRTSITSPDTGLTEYRFDPAGNLAERVTPNLRAQSATAAIRNSYQFGRLTRMDYPDLLLDGAMVPQTPTVISYGEVCPAPCYDPTVANARSLGRVASRSDASGVTTYEYGSLGEVTRTTQSLVNPDDPTGGTIVGPYVTNYEHDRFGRMRSVTYPNTERVDYRYDAGGSLSSVDMNCPPVSVDPPSVPDPHCVVGGYVKSILYNEFGQRTQVRYGNDIVSHFTYTAAMHRLETLNTDNVAASEGGPRTVTAQSILYSYASNGNIVGTLNVGAGTGSAGAPRVAQTYEYDALDQLRSAVGNYSIPTASGTEEHHYVSTFQYDQLGRMSLNQQHDSTSLAGLVVSTAARDLTYGFGAGAPGQPVHAPEATFDSAAGQTTAYQWDANGNQIGSNIKYVPGSRELQWDHEDRLAQFTQHSGTGVPDVTARYLYDAGGTRTHKIAPADGTLTLYPNQFTSVRRLLGTGATGPYYNLTTNHVYAGEERVASSVAKSSNALARQTYWYHGDHLTSTNWVTNSAGVITEHLEYYPFGEPWVAETGAGSTGPGTPEAYRYTAKEQDGESGLYYFGARYYDARIAVWASADPALAEHLSGSSAFEPTRLLGLYSYALNSPLALLDPDGRDACAASAGRDLSPEDVSRERLRNASREVPAWLENSDRTMRVVAAAAEGLTRAAPATGRLIGGRRGAAVALVGVGAVRGTQVILGSGFNGLPISRVAAATQTVAALISAGTELFGTPDSSGMNMAEGLPSQRVAGQFDTIIAQHSIERGHFGAGTTVAQALERIEYIRENGQATVAANGNRLTRLGQDLLIDDLISEGSAGTVFRRTDNIPRYVAEWLRNNQ